jgi:AbrB family looped-hinge helix DNA binding protein
MKIAMDPAGRVVIPKDVRTRLGLADGGELEMRERDGVIELEPASVPMSLRKGPHGLVIVPDHELPPLTDEIVRETLDRVRR